MIGQKDIHPRGPEEPSTLQRLGKAGVAQVEESSLERMWSGGWKG